jgi:uncharacterized protein RhaS with RHS repeats
LVGDLVQVVFPDNTGRRYFYDSRHLMTLEENERGFATTRQFDTFGRFVQATLATGSVRTATPAVQAGLVDPASGLGTQASPAPVTRLEAGVSTREDGEGRLRTSDPGPLGAATALTDPAGLTTAIQRDADANPTRTELPPGDIFDRDFDERGNLLDVTDSVLGGTTAFTYEPTFNQVTSITDSRAQTASLDYDRAVARWTAKDPIRFESGDINLYGYVLNDSVNLVDPSGSQSVFSGAGLGLLPFGQEFDDPVERCLKTLPLNVYEH